MGKMMGGGLIVDSAMIGTVRRYYRCCHHCQCLGLHCIGIFGSKGVTDFEQIYTRAEA